MIIFLRPRDGILTAQQLLVGQPENIKLNLYLKVIFLPESSTSLQHGGGSCVLGVVRGERVHHVHHIHMMTGFYEVWLLVFPPQVRSYHVGLETVIVCKDRPVPLFIWKG